LFQFYRIETFQKIQKQVGQHTCNLCTLQYLTFTQSNGEKNDNSEVIYRKIIRFLDLSDEHKVY